MENQKNQLQEGWIRLPGLIDVHVHFREPGQEWKEDWTTGTAAALAGGVTLVCAMPNTRPPLIDLETLELTRQLAGQKSLCDWALYCGGSNNSFTLNPLLAPHCVALKLYLDHTFTTLQLDDMSVWSQHFRSFPPDRPVVVHAEKANMAAAILHAHLLRRPIHIAHVSLAQEIELIRQCKQVLYFGFFFLLRSDLILWIRPQCEKQNFLFLIFLVDQIYLFAKTKPKKNFFFHLSRTKSKSPVR